MASSDKDVTVVPTDDAQRSLIRDEAIAAWSARNRIREFFTLKIGEMILKGAKPDEIRQMRQAFDELMTDDTTTSQILQSLTS